MKDQSLIPLNSENLPKVPKELPVPEYPRKSAQPQHKILHIGVGGFHRAHMAAYTDQLLGRGIGDWVINGVGLTERDRTMADTMTGQDGLYTLISRGNRDEEARVIGSITDYFFVPDGAGQLCRDVADDAYRIISMTVTENGYHYSGDERNLDFKDPAIIRDVADPTNPTTVIGFVFRIAQLRIQDGKTLPTFLSCDNLPHNGSLLRKLVLQFAEKVDTTVADALKGQGKFPNCMVDRITPATEQKDRDYVAKTWGIQDEWPVVCEDFIQWFIEDDFSDGRPRWEDVGANMISDVTPFEHMKIRLLNGSHSALAYISYLLGFRAVDDAMGDPDVREFVRRYMKEIEPTVGTVPDVNIQAYQEKLIERFSNSAIRDQVLRLCEDGSRKIPNMILDPLSELLRDGMGYRHASFAIAAWIVFLQGTDQNGEVIPVKDPNAETIQEAAKQCEQSAAPFLSQEAIFPNALRSSDAFHNEINTWFHLIRKSGPRRAIQQLLATEKQK
jgi:mannitol 2-dehydrogenase